MLWCREGFPFIYHAYSLDLARPDYYLPQLYRLLHFCSDTLPVIFHDIQTTHNHKCGKHSEYQDRDDSDPNIV